MKHKRKIALLSVATIPAVITMLPSTDVQAETTTPETTDANGIGKIILGKIQNYETSFTVKFTNSADDLTTALNNFFNTLSINQDTKLLADAILSHDYTYTGYPNNFTVTFDIKYNTTPAEVETVKTTAKGIVDSILKTGMTDLQKIKAIHDYVVTNSTYTKVVENNKSPYSAHTLLTSKKGVSQAYAQATYYLLTAAGFDAHYITGTYQNTPHSLNVVKYNNQWYYLDTALDEPSIYDATITDTKAISYEHFLMGTNELGASKISVSGSPSSVDSIESDSPTNLKAIRGVFNPIQVGDMLYYVKKTGELASLDLTPLPNIDGPGSSTAKLEENIFTDTENKFIKAKYLIYNDGWLYFNNVNNGGYLYKVKTDTLDNTDNPDFKPIVKNYVRDLQITGLTLNYKKSNGQASSVNITVDNNAGEKVINLITKYNQTSKLEDLVNAQVEYDKLTASQKVMVNNVNGSSFITTTGAISQTSAEGIALRIARLDPTDANFNAEVNKIKVDYTGLTDQATKDIVYNYQSQFVDKMLAMQASNSTPAYTVQSKIENLISNSPTYYTNLKSVLNDFNALNAAQQALVTSKQTLLTAVTTMENESNEVVPIIYQINLLDDTNTNFEKAFTKLKSSIEALSERKKSLITNASDFEAAKTKYGQYETLVNKLETDIALINSNTTTLDQLNALYARYTTLNPAQKTMLEQSSLTNLRNAIADDFAKSNTLTTVAEKIIDLSASKTTFVADVKDARIALDAFVSANTGTTLPPEDQTKLNSAQLTLVIAEALVEKIGEINTAISKIDTNLPTPVPIDFQTTYKNKVNDAQGLIGVLKGLTKITISNDEQDIPEKLKMGSHAEKHITKLDNLTKAKETLTKSEEVKTAIAGLKTEEQIDSLEKAKEVRIQYEGLTSMGKYFVGDISKLIILEGLYHTASAQEVIDLIQAIDITKDTFVEYVKIATDKYKLLSTEAKQIVDSSIHIDTLKEAQLKAAPLTAIYEAIEALATTDAKEYKVKVDAAQSAFDKLDIDQKRFITNSEKLTTAQGNITAAKTVTDAISSLTKDSTEVAILTVEQQYNALTPFQKELVTNYPTLETFIDKAYGKDKALAVVTMIDKLDDKKTSFAVDVRKAREAYEALTTKQKEYVTNLADLVAAERKVSDLVDTSDIAKKMIAQIAAINDTIASFKTDVEAAQSAYAALPDAQKALVTNYSTLTSHQATYDTYHATAKQLETKITELNNTSPNYQSTLTTLQNQYNSMNAAQKAFIPEYAVKLLSAAQSGIDAVRSATNMILALNSSKSTFHADVANARAAYNALIKNYGVYLPTYVEEALAAAEALVAKDKSAARKVVDAINALSSESIYKEIERARRIYNNLTAPQRTLVTNLQTLIDFETGKLSYNYSGIPSGVDTGKNDKPTTEEPTIPSFAAVPGERTSMTKSPSSNTYTAKIYVDDEVGNNDRFVLTTKSNVTAIIPPTVTIVSEKTGTMAIEINADSNRINFKATLDNKPVTFATDVQLVVESVPAKSVVYRVDQFGNRTPATYSVDGNQYTISTKGSDTFIIARPSTTFMDIGNDSHREYIEALTERKIIQSTANGQFNPNKGITRAEFASMLARALEVYPTETTNFNDIRGKSYENDVQALYEIGIIEGVSPTTFNPDRILTRQQAAMMVERMLDYVGVTTTVWESPQFTDADQIAASAENAVALMQSLGIVSGKANGAFDPNGQLTRSQLAKILYKALETANLL